MCRWFGEFLPEARGHCLTHRQQDSWLSRSFVLLESGFCSKLIGVFGSDKSLISFHVNPKLVEEQPFSFLNNLNSQGVQGVDGFFPQGNDLLMPQMRFTIKQFSELGEARRGGEMAFRPSVIFSIDAHVAQGAAVRQPKTIVFSDGNCVHDHNPKWLTKHIE